MIKKKKTISKVKAAENIKAFRRELRDRALRGLILRNKIMDREMLLRAVDYVQRGKKSCEDAAENLLNHEPALSYYRGKAKAFSEVLAVMAQQGGSDEV